MSAAAHPARIGSADYSFYDKLNNVWHKRALNAFTFIVLAHWAEHLTQAPVNILRLLLLLWIGIAAVSGVAAGLGYVALDGASEDTVAFVMTFAAGAILSMLASTISHCSAIAA